MVVSVRIDLNLMSKLQIIGMFCGKLGCFVVKMFGFRGAPQKILNRKAM